MPEHILTGGDKKANELRVINFGRTDTYVDIKSHEHVPSGSSV